jgi:hypothetical protein
MSSDADKKRLAALARASEVYVCIDLIERYTSHLKQLMDNHDPAKGDNAKRRDCAEFERRLKELLLWDKASAMRGG